MKRFFQKLTDIMADAALLEMGVGIQTTAEYRFKTVSGPVMSPLKRLFQDVSDTLADAALLEMGVDAASPIAKAGTVQYIVNLDECQYGDNEMCFDRRAA